MNNFARSLTFLAVLLGAACNVTTTGDQGILTFTPDDCGQAWCSLDTDLAAGTSLELTLGTSHDGWVSGLTVVSEDPQVALVFPLAFERWHVVATGPGRARLSVIDPGGHYVDGTSVFVVMPTRLALDRVVGSATARYVGPGEEIWVASSTTDLVFRVRPVDAYGASLMGKLDLSTEIDAILYDALDPSSRVTEGELIFRPLAPGDYWMTVSSPNDYLDVGFEIL